MKQLQCAVEPILSPQTEYLRARRPVSGTQLRAQRSMRGRAILDRLNVSN